ncbi:MAG: putative D-isomer specific 2-hydroxyacid dehydrogenase [Rhodoferax sp.]|nr:putative D-isomer specific 2-hydroxyacid dehydrogenase [Rhodoferax sp.]
MSSAEEISTPNSKAALPELLQIGPLPPGLVALLTPHYRLHPLWLEADRAGFTKAHVGRFAGGVTMSRHGCDAATMACLAGSVVACFGVGFEGLDLAAARRHAVAVSTTPDVLTDCVADIAFGLVLATARQIVAADRFVQAGRWPAGMFPLATKVSGKRMGIVGLGRIGAAIARRATGFDMVPRYHGRHAQPAAPYGFEPDLAALARWADFLVVACRGGPETHHLVSAGVIEALGPAGFLINIARGSVVDEAALADAVQRQAIAGAGLDVFENEPQVPAALLGNDRVVVLPHVAAGTRETRAAMEQLVLDNLQAFFRTGQVATPPA